jgi:hypothetical protein
MMHLVLVCAGHLFKSRVACFFNLYQAFLVLNLRILLYALDNRGP